MQPLEWITLMTIYGPCDIWGCGVENSTPEWIKWQLVRDTGSVIVQMLVQPFTPYHHFDLDDFGQKRPRSQFEMYPGDGPLVVPEGTSVLLQATSQEKCEVNYGQRGASRATFNP